MSTPHLGNLAAERLVQLLPENSLILDIGAGDGAASRYFRQHGHGSLTLDLAEGSDFRGDFNTAALVSDNFDAVWASHVLEHQPNPIGFLAKCYRILRPGGLLCVTVPPLKHEIVSGHLNLYNAGLLLYQLIHAGFDCSSARIKGYGYNISIIVERIPSDLTGLTYNAGDLQTLDRFFPVDASSGSFSGVIESLNW